MRISKKRQLDHLSMYTWIFISTYWFYCYLVIDVANSKKRPHFLYQKPRTIDTDTPVTIDRSITQEMHKFIISHHGHPAVCIYGPLGVGKSSSLYQVVCTLVSQPNNRVIYVPDCGFWGSLEQDTALYYLLECIKIAFPEDFDIVSKCNVAQSAEDLVYLIKVIVALLLYLSS